MKTTKEICNDNVKDYFLELTHIDDDNKKWYSEEEIRKIINKHKTTSVSVGDGCFDEADYEVIKVKDLLKELFGDKDE